MALMDVIRKMASNKGETSAKFKELQENDRLQTMLEERKKSSNQRALEKHFKDEREKQFKEQLDKIRKQQTKTSWKGDSILDKGASILKSGKSIMKDDKPILMQKNIFLDNKTKNPVTKKGMFFKK